MKVTRRTVRIYDNLKGHKEHVDMRLDTNR